MRAWRQQQKYFNFNQLQRKLIRMATHYQMDSYKQAKHKTILTDMRTLEYYDIALTVAYC